MRPTPEVAARIEELLREELSLLGENPRTFKPEEIAANMECEVQDDNSMTYIWKGLPILHVQPEPTENGVHWRMFTREEPL